MTPTLADSPAETEIAETEVLSGGFKRMIRHRLRHRTPDGEWSAAMTRDLHEGNRVAAVIAFDPARDALVLIRQYRLGAHLAMGKGELVEIVAGGVEAGEDPALAARRELKEETGLDALTLTHAFDFLPSPGITMESASVYLATVDSTSLPAMAGEDEDEAVLPFAVPVAEALAALDANRMMNGFLQLGLHWFARQRAAGNFLP